MLILSRTTESHPFPSCPLLMKLFLSFYPINIIIIIIIIIIINHHYDHIRFIKSCYTQLDTTLIMKLNAIDSLKIRIQPFYGE